MLLPVRVAPNECVLVVRNGHATELLGPGRYRLWGSAASIALTRYDRDAHFTPATPELVSVLGALGLEHEVPANTLGLLTANGVPTAVLTPGRWVLWHGRAEVECAEVSTLPLMATVPAAFRPLMPAGYLTTTLVLPYQKALLYADGKLEATLDAGRFDVWARDRAVAVVMVELREREVQIVGQEVMTADKVTLRMNLVVKFHVVDAVLATHTVAALEAGVYSEAQLATRDLVAGLTVDGLLEKRGEVGTTLRANLGERLATWGVVMDRIDLKDVVLPGEMKALLNQVIEAEKRAAANVITRREETAATRSLANTARLLESNPTLLRLKELEAWKEIAQSVGQVNVMASPQQLYGALSLPSPPPSERKEPGDHK